MSTDHPSPELRPFEPTRHRLRVTPFSGSHRVLSKRALFAELFERAWEDAPLGDTPVVVVDGTLDPEDSDVSTTVNELRSAGCSISVVLCDPNPLLAGAWIDLGAASILTHDASMSEVRSDIERLSSGEPVLGIAVRESLLRLVRSHRQIESDRRALYRALTRRERAVLHELARGASPEAIARSSYVSMNTVRSQIRSVLSKLDVVSVTAAIALAYRSGWIDSSDTAELEFSETGRTVLR